ncbi:MAG: glycoside hydrolase family 25 protein [Eubacterium sp.]|nr:glycoside hydrolase family 25 protein [Eubacterium sp.]
MKRFWIVICILVIGVQPVSAAVPAWTEVDGIYYNDKGEVIEGAVSKGIDVSKHQGKIDWAKVKQTDINFAIIRCGYGDDYTFQDDEYFATNVKGCETNHIPYGIYIYSYATNTTMAKSEANHVLRLINQTGAKPTMPVYYDLEDSSQENLTAKKFGDIAETFCNIIMSKGYTVGVYASLYWWNTKLTDSRFNNWFKWVAQYNSKCAYEGAYDMWQYSSTGKVNGISGNSDMNILLTKNCSMGGHVDVIVSSTGKASPEKSATITYKCNLCGRQRTQIVYRAKKVSLSKKTYRYTGKENKPKVTIRDSKGNVISSKNYTVTYKNHIKPGQAKVIINFKNLYEGTVTRTFTIKPAKAVLSSIKNVKRKKMIVKWKKAKGADGYEVGCANNKAMTKGLRVANVKAPKKTKTIKKLNLWQKYYIRVRAYKKINGVKVYGYWSSKKHLVITK